MFRLSIILVLSIHIHSSAQVHVTFGKPYRVFAKFENPVEENKFYLKKGDQILSLKRKNSSMYLQKLNTHNLSLGKIHIYEDFPKKYEIENVTTFSDRFYLFYSLRDSRNQKELLYYREIDFEAGVFVGKAKLILSYSGKISALPGDKKFYFEKSFKDARMVIRHKAGYTIDDKKRRHENIQFSIFDSNLNLLTEKKHNFPYPLKKARHLDYSVDTAGNFYILSQVLKDKHSDTIRKSKVGSVNYYMELSTIKFPTSNTIFFPLIISDTPSQNSRIINKISLFESPGSNVICAGTYVQWRNYPEHGIFLVKIGSEGKYAHPAFYEIPQEISGVPKEKKETKKNNAIQIDKSRMADLNLNELIIQSDGSFLLISEQNFEVIHPYYNRVRRETIYLPSLHFNDIFLTKIDSNGKLNWVRKLPKSQTGLFEKGAMSYQYFTGDKYHYLMYMDHKDNHRLGLNESQNTYQDSTAGSLTAYRINDEDGKVARIPLLETKSLYESEAFRVFPSRILPVSNNEFITEVTVNKEKDMLIKIKINE